MPTRAQRMAMLPLASLFAAVFATAPARATDGLIPAGLVVTLGAQAIAQPKYEGGKDYEVNAAPIIKFSGANLFPAFLRVDARNINDIGLGLLNFGGFSAGPAVGYRFDREEDDGRLLRGLGDVDGGFLVGGFARYDFKLSNWQETKAYGRVSYLTQVSGDEDTGGILRLQGGVDSKLAPSLFLKSFAAVEFADDDYMQTYFGVTAAQSARSGLGQFSPDAGAKSFHIGTTAEYEFAPTWTVTAGIEYARLIGDAADSPVVEQEDYVIGRLGLSKAFTIGR